MATQANVGPAFQLSDEHGKARVVLQAPPKGQTGFLVADPSGQKRVLLVRDEKDNALLVLADKTGSTTAAMAVAPNGEGGISLDRDGTNLWSVPLAPKSEPK